MSDVWQRYYGAEFLSPDVDSDGDSFSNRVESLAGTDPLDRLSKPGITKVARVTNQISLRWHGKAGVRYRVEQAGSPAGPWHTAAERQAFHHGDLWQWLYPSEPGRSFFRVGVNATPAVLPQWDSDGDGQDDAAEVLTGTDPYDPSSRFAVKEVRFEDGVRVEFRTEPGVGYQIQSYRGNTLGWANVGPRITGSGQPATSFVPDSGNTMMLRLTFSSVDTDGDGVTDWEETVAGLDPLRPRTLGGLSNDAAVIRDLLAEPEIYEVRAIRAVAASAGNRDGLVEVRRSSGLGRARLALEIGGDAVPGVDVEKLPTSLVFPREDKAARLIVQALPGASKGREVTIRTLDPTLMHPGYPEGATVRILQPSVLSVSEFGAVGDGVTDDTAAIQAAITALEADDSLNTLRFPAGVYRMASAVNSNETYTSSKRLLKLGTNNLTGRDLILSGDPGAVLYSAVSPVHAHMLVAMATFRSLRIEGLTFEKSDTPMAPGSSWGADGVSLVQVDQRKVEEVSFINTSFINCHGAVFTYGTGFDIRGHLRTMNFEGCRILNPWGTNTTDIGSQWGGGQQVAMGAWVGTASYIGCTFEGGGEDMSDSYRSPAGRLKDGCHFGSPMRLVFHGNVVRRMSVEAVYQLNRTSYMGTSAVAFTLPAADGLTPVTVPVRLDDSTYLPGQLLNFRIPTSRAQAGRNTILRVTGWNPESHDLTVVNDGHDKNPAPGTILPRLLPVYLQEPPAGEVDIRGNHIDGSRPHGAERTNPSGIVTDVRGVVRDNTIVNCATGINTSQEASVPLYPGATGLLITDNLIVLRHPDESLKPVTYGIKTHSDEILAARNRIICPLSRRSVGIVLRGRNARVNGNHISAIDQIDNGYHNPDRSVGILVGNSSFGTAIDGNTTRRFDVGVGPEPSQWIIHSVTDHTSIEDIYPVDFRGLVDP